jgi:hypothetical protein
VGVERRGVASVRRLALGIALVCVLALASCGGDEAASPLDEALGYLPENAPFAVALDTALEGEQYRALGRIADKFPFGD